jgi:hypothetical protein
MMKKRVTITINPDSYGCSIWIASMAQMATKQRLIPGSDQYTSLKDRELPINYSEYVRDVMARFDQIGFDDCRPSEAKHRILQAAKD